MSSSRSTPRSRSAITARYLVGRLFQAAVILLLVVSAVFLLARLSGDPAQLLAPQNASEQDIADIRQNLGLNDPLIVQYLRYLGDLLTGDLGASFVYRAPVRDLIEGAFPNTLLLAMSAFLLAVVVGVPLGIVSALRPSSVLDYVSRFTALVGQSVPSFWLGMVLIWVLSVLLGWLPAFGAGSPSQLILPTIALGAYPVAVIARLSRSAALDVLRSDHTLFERSKGVSGFVFMRHVLRNASLPVVTLSGIQLGHLLAGTVIVETLFAWPGMGQLAIQATYSRDFNVVQGTVLVFALTFVVLNLLVDLSYGWLDPRVRVSGGSSRGALR
ncbi:ABC transporter permease [Pseudonocardia sp. GCM10023141]|uniref:ABC transporter permease n=1 Tax=Pseudonocardia sp. GCM10023141 TaxID=3252653 RepID=UPI003617EA4C